MRPVFVLLLLSMPALPAQASSQLALDKGCYSCHGEPPRRNTPSMAQLAAEYAQYRGQTDAPRKLADKLRAGGLFGHIAAHERLSPADCETLMRWIIDGANKVRQTTTPAHRPHRCRPDDVPRPARAPAVPA